MVLLLVFLLVLLFIWSDSRVLVRILLILVCFCLLFVLRIMFWIKFEILKIELGWVLMMFKYWLIRLLDSCVCLLFKFFFVIEGGFGGIVVIDDEVGVCCVGVVVVEGVFCVECWFEFLLLVLLDLLDEWFFELVLLIVLWMRLLIFGMGFSVIGFVFKGIIGWEIIGVWLGCVCFGFGGGGGFLYVFVFGIGFCLKVYFLLLFVGLNVL